MNKLILVDCDGVILDWESMFHEWMKERHYTLTNDHKSHYDIALKYGISYEESYRLVDIFNQSAACGFLDPYLDSVYYIKLLHEKHGYKFHAITSMHDNVYAKQLRIMNLKRLFGETTFEGFTILGCGADKYEALSKYKDTGYWWIEDKESNAQEGLKLGLRSLLMAHKYNENSSGIPKVKNWSEIYFNVTCDRWQLN